MIPVPEDASRQDVEQWCNRCVVMYSHGSAWFPAFFLQCDERRMCRLEPLVSSEDNKEPEEIRVSASRLAVEWPMCGSVNLPIEKFALHADRRTQRQYRRSFHRDALNIIIPRLWDVAKSKGVLPKHVIAGDVDLARACFYPEYFTVDVAEKMIESGERVSVALSRSVIMAGDSTGKRMFFFNGILAASGTAAGVYPVDNERAYLRVIKLLEGKYNAASYP
jgi:hypothetical protein